MSIECQADWNGLREVGRIVGITLEAMRKHVRPGMTTADLNAIGAETLSRHGAHSAPMQVYNFPAEVCICLNDEVVHGIPSDRIIKPGDILKLDVTAEKDGYMADAAISVAVEPVLEMARALIACAELAFYTALSVARAGNRVNQIGRVVSYVVKKHGFSVVRNLYGHGIGRAIHEEPSVPNTYDFRARQRLTKGLVLTIEPMITTGGGQSVEAADGWTIKTVDGMMSAHYEHTLVITDGRPILLTAA